MEGNVYGGQGRIDTVDGAQSPSSLSCPHTPGWGQHHGMRVHSGYLEIFVSECHHCSDGAGEEGG